MVAVGVIGSGAWGTTLAYLLAKKGFETTLWDHHPERAIDMQRKRENADFLPGIRFPAMLHVTPHIVEAVEGNETLLVNASKGIEIGSLKRMTEVISEEIPGTHNRVVALSGPNIAQEVAEGKPTAAVVAAHKEDIATRARTLLTTARFRVYTASDIVGVELGGALKNIIAIGAGFSDGMGYGNNAKAAFMTRGLAEIARLGIAAGANPLTFTGLAGIGDLIATCAGPLSRNQQLGRRLATGESLAAIQASMHSVVEGVYTTKAALQLADRYHVEMPITRQLSLVLCEGLDPQKAVPELMMRDPKRELEGMI